MKSSRDLEPSLSMTYAEFLATVKVLKMLYGRDIAEKFFTKNIIEVYNISSESLPKNKERKA